MVVVLKNARFFGHGYLGIVPSDEVRELEACVEALGGEEADCGEDADPCADCCAAFEV